MFWKNRFYTFNFSYANCSFPFIHYLIAFFISSYHCSRMKEETRAMYEMEAGVLGVNLLKGSDTPAAVANLISAGPCRGGQQ